MSYLSAETPGVDRARRVCFSLRALCASARTSRRAFSLIEVNMALLVVGIGLAALLGLFPAALRESSLASADTSQAMFADQVLNMLHANASVITNWSQWNGAYTNFLKGVNPAPEDDVRVPVVNPDGFANILEGQHTITNYLTKGSFIEYNLNLSRPTENIVRAWLRVADRKMTDINKNPIYYTEFIFMGM